jgi:hypothetical protein
LSAPLRSSSTVTTDETIAAMIVAIAGADRRLLQPPDGAERDGRQTPHASSPEEAWGG